MKKSFLIIKFSKVISALILLILSSCHKEDDQTRGDDFIYYSLYASRNADYYDPVNESFKTSFTFEGSSLFNHNDSIKVYVDGEQMSRYESGILHCEKRVRYNDGDVVKVTLHHSVWGEFELDYIFPDSPDTFYYHPIINEWIKRVGDDNMENDSLHISFPHLNYCNQFWGMINLNTHPTDTNSTHAVHQANNLFFKNQHNDTEWNHIKEGFLNGKLLNIYCSFGWQKKYEWKNHCQINAYCISFANNEYVYYPANIQGTWDMSASYRAYTGLYSVHVTNETDILNFIQDGNHFTITTHQNLLGEVAGNKIQFEGDILPGEGNGGYQYFTGTVNGNSITGYFSGTVMAQFPGQNLPDLGYLSTGNFTLTKRSN